MKTKVEKADNISRNLVTSIDNEKNNLSITANFNSKIQKETKNLKNQHKKSASPEKKLNEFTE